MSFLPHAALRCPLDSLPMEQQGTSLQCSNGHSFDISRQGYVNLLGAQDKRSRDPGDSKAMITARHDFLNGGYYQPIADRLSQLVERLLTEGSLPAEGSQSAEGSLPAEGSLIADAGCGEGYYLQQLAESIGAAGKAPPALLGFDISKWAMQAAARRFPATWLVASNRHIPLADQSADVVLSLFGFPEYPAFRRILKKSGALLMVNAGPQHLVELREIIYPRIRFKTSDRIEAASAAGFSLLERTELSYNIAALNQTAINQLLAMTPHMFRASSEGKRRAAALTELSLTVDVVFEVLRLST
jgi:23S rRNA (guanine745-N1)-methyltransferase